MKRIKTIYKKLINRIRKLNTMQFAVIAFVLFAILVAIQVSFILNDSARRREAEERVRQEAIDTEVQQQIQNSRILDLPLESVDDYEEILDRNNLDSTYLPSGALLRELEKNSTLTDKQKEEIKNNPPRDF